MSPPPHGDDNNFFAETPKEGTAPTPHHEGPRTVVTSMSSKLPPKGWAVVGGGAVLAVGLLGLFIASRFSGPKGIPDMQLSAAQAQVSKLEDQVKELNAAIGAAQRARGGEDAANTAAPSAAAVAAAPSQEQSRLVQELADSLNKKLTKEMEKGEAALNRDANGLTLVLSDKLVFETGVDDISDSGEAILRHVGNVIGRVRGHDIEIRSFTDAKPIPSENEERYSSNWELSALRATQVVRFFQDESNIDPNHLVAMSYGQYHPAEGMDKKRIRRIEVVIPTSAAGAGKRNLE